MSPWVACSRHVGESDPLHVSSDSPCRTEEVGVPDNDEVETTQAQESVPKASSGQVSHDSVNTAPDEGSTYDASAIIVLEGLEEVRNRPGMYIGSTGERGLHLLICDLVDHTAHASLARYCARIVLTFPSQGASRVPVQGPSH